MAGDRTDARAERLLLLFWLLRAAGVLGAFASAGFFVGYVLLASAAESTPGIGIRPLFAELPDVEAARVMRGWLAAAAIDLGAGFLYLMGYLTGAFIGFVAAAGIALATSGYPWWLPYAALAGIALLTGPVRARAAAAQIARDSLLRRPER